MAKVKFLRTGKVAHPSNPRSSAQVECVEGEVAEVDDEIAAAYSETEDPWLEVLDADDEPEVEDEEKSDEREDKKGAGASEDKKGDGGRRRRGESKSESKSDPAG